MRIKVLLSLFLLIFASFSNIFSPTKSSSNHKEGTLEISSLPYLTTLSLGDDLYLEGLMIKNGDNNVSINEVDFQGHDSTNLGTQTIIALYQGKHAWFDVYITNEFVNNYIPLGNLFISEFIYLNDDKLAIEIYNNSLSAISLGEYSLHFKNDKETVIIGLGNNEININETHLVSNYLIDEINYQYNHIDVSNVAEVSLFKKDFAIDKVIFNNLEYSSKTMRRHYKNYNSSSVFNPKEWIFTNGDLSDVGKHKLLENIVTQAEQARAYARYVLFGAGMFASGRVKEAFGVLKTEYELMSGDSKDYFYNNKSEKVEGYNENGKYVSMSFQEAQSRIGLIASESGNNSFLPPKKNNILENKNLLIVGVILAILLIMIAIYFYISRTKKRYEQRG